MKVKRAVLARPLWTCPKCGQKFVTKSLWHSCGLATAADWKKRMSPKVRTLYDRFESLIAHLDDQVQRWIARAYRTMGTHGLNKP